MGTVQKEIWVLYMRKHGTVHEEIWVLYMHYMNKIQKMLKEAEMEYWRDQFDSASYSKEFWEATPRNGFYLEIHEKY